MLHLALFSIFGAICVAGAVNLLVQRHPINSALSLIAVMTSLGTSVPVARATTRTVVAASITVLISDFFLTKLFLLS